MIPAAGLGTRFTSRGVTTPKELLPLGGRPLIGHALAEAARAGFEAAVIVISPAKNELRDYLIGIAPPLPVEIVVQGKPLGIGDAVRQGWEGQACGVLLPDDVVVETQHWVDLLDLHGRTGAAALCVRPVPIASIGRFGIAECEGTRVVRLIEKPTQGATKSNLAIFGRYVVTSSVIGGLDGQPREGELELTSGFAAAIATGLGVQAVRFRGRIYDCGTPDEYALSTADFMS